MRAPQISWLALLVCALLLVEQCAAKQAPKVRAQRRHREWMSKQHAQQAIRRSLLQDDSAAGAPAPAPAGAPLELPSDAMNVCSYEKLRKATKCSNNKKVFYEAEGPDEECCELMSSYYSNASTKPTRNCWCDPDVWARELELELKTYITLGSFFDGCTASNYTVGDESIAYYQDGAGPCGGLPAAAAEEEEMETPTYPPKRSFGKWCREGLPDNPFVLFCFIVSIPSVIGFMIMMWPFIFHAVLTVVELPGKMKAKKTT